MEIKGGLFGPGLVTYNWSLMTFWLVSSVTLLLASKLRYVPNSQQLVNAGPGGQNQTDYENRGNKTRQMGKIVDAL